MRAGLGVSIHESRVVDATIYIRSTEPTEESVEVLAPKEKGERQASSDKGQ